MQKEIIEKLLEIKKNNKTNLQWYCEFNDMYSSDDKLFSDSLIELRDSNFDCIDDELLIENINSCSSIFCGKDWMLLEVFLLMLYFEIDVEKNIRTMLDIFLTSKFKEQQVVMQTMYSTCLFKIFTKSSATHSNNNLLCEINDYIDVNAVDTILLAELYYSVIKKNKPRLVKKLPEKVFYVGIVSQAFGIIDGDGLSCFYRHFKPDYITTLCEFLKSNGGEKYADIIEYGLEFRKDQRKLDHLENKIYNLEKKISIDKLLSNYLEHSADY